MIDLASYKKAVPSFEDFIKNEINPQRRENNLPELSDTDILRCKNILLDFNQNWEKKEI